MTNKEEALRKAFAKYLRGEMPSSASEAAFIAEYLTDLALEKTRKENPEQAVELDLLSKNELVALVTSTAFQKAKGITKDQFLGLLGRVYDMVDFDRFLEIIRS